MTFTEELFDQFSSLAFWWRWISSVESIHSGLGKLSSPARWEWFYKYTCNVNFVDIRQRISTIDERIPLGCISKLSTTSLWHCSLHYKLSKHRKPQSHGNIWKQKTQASNLVTKYVDYNNIQSNKSKDLRHQLLRKIHKQSPKYLNLQGIVNKRTSDHSFFLVSHDLDSIQFKFAHIRMSKCK